MSNPAIRETLIDRFPRAREESDVMTVQGTLNKVLCGFALMTATATYAWMHPHAPRAVVIGVWLAAFLIGLAICLRPALAQSLFFPYAALEGLFIGTLSWLVNRKHAGIVLEAAVFTFATSALFFIFYRFKVIEVTEKVWSIVTTATCALCVVYLSHCLVRLFHGEGFWFINDNGPVGIGVSLLAVGLAGFNLLLDFDFVEKAVAQKSDRNTEWYAAFAVLVTVVWMYVAMLRLLSKLKK